MVLCIDILPFPDTPPSRRNIPRYLHDTKSVAVNDQIWYLIGIDSADPSNSKYQIHFRTLNTENHEVTIYGNCETPFENGMLVESATSDGDFIYILLRRSTERNCRLLKFDTKSMSFINDYLIETGNTIQGPFFVQENYIYYKDRVFVKKLDLTDKSIKAYYQLQVTQSLDSTLMLVNNEVHLVCAFGNNRVVAMFDDNLVPQTISQDTSNFDRPFLVTNGTLFEQKDTPLDPNKIKNVIDTFDFDKRKWCQVVDRDIQKVTRNMIVETVTECNGRFYIFAANYVRVLDLQPKLGDICLTNIIKKMLADPMRATRIMEELPIPQRDKVKKIIMFRLGEVDFNSIFN